MLNEAYSFSTDVMFDFPGISLQKLPVLSIVDCKLYHHLQCTFLWFHFHNKYT
jgi:hypothetical protein